jgi:hypothetical protein
MRFKRVLSFAALLLCVCVRSAQAYLPIYLHPEARAAGNERPVAVRLARALLTQMWPASVEQVRVEGFGRHRVAGIVLSGVKFHQSIDAEGFLDEVSALVSKAFAAADVEEVDVWALVPIPVPKGAIVSGDLAVPTNRTVFACSVPRSRLLHLEKLLHDKSDVYWEESFISRLQMHVSPAASKAPRLSGLSATGDSVVS